MTTIDLGDGVRVHEGPGWLGIEIGRPSSAPASNWRDWLIKVVCDHLKIARDDLRNFGSERLTDSENAQYKLGFRFLLTIKSPELHSGHYFVSGSGLMVIRLPLEE